MDKEIINIINELNDGGYTTIASCAGHMHQEDFEFYVMFEYTEELEEKITNLQYFDKIISKTGEIIQKDSILLTYIKSGNFKKESELEKTQALLKRELRRL